MVTAPLSHYGSTSVPCEGATSDVDTVSDTMLISVPVRCVTTSLRPVRFHVSSTSSGVFEESRGLSRYVGYDDLYTAQPLRTR